MINTQEKLNLISELSMMLSSGIPVLDAVDSIAVESKGGIAKVAKSMSADITSGKTLSESLSKFSDFDKITINLIKSGEESGNLEKVLVNIENTLKREIELSDKIKQALVYPIAIGVVFIGVLLVILIFVIPRVADVFSRLKMTLPLPTRILIYVSNLLTQNTWQVLLGLLLLISAFMFLYLKKRKLIILMFSKLPLINTLVTELDLSRFTTSMYLLLSSGVTISTSLVLAQEVVSQKKISKIIELIGDSVNKGGKVTDELIKERKIIPQTMIRIISSGEKSGKLEGAFMDLSRYFEDRVEKRLKNLTTLIEPIMLVVVGIMVGGMMLSIIAPIYGMIGQIKAR